MSLEDIQARREAARAAYESARAAQYEIDLAALADIEEEHGYGAVESLPVKGFTPGIPTMAIIRSPGGTRSYFVYTDKVHAAKQDIKQIANAQLELGRVCLLYPPPGEVRDAMVKAYPGLFISCAVRAVKLAELDSEEEKKG